MIALRLRGAALLAVAVVVAGCGDTPGGAGFPDTVEHALGCTDQDAILALGVVPVGIRELTRP